jgi:hypothetical protein
MIQDIGPHRVTNVSIEDPLVDQMLAGSRIAALPYKNAARGNARPFARSETRRWCPEKRA